jgi:hypothetical protein
MAKADPIDSPAVAAFPCLLTVAPPKARRTARNSTVCGIPSATNVGLALQPSDVSPSFHSFEEEPQIVELFEGGFLKKRPSRVTSTIEQDSHLLRGLGCCQ